MSLQIYSSYELELTFNGQIPLCVTGLVLAESTTLIRNLSTASSWKRFDPNLQSFSIQCDGIDEGAYNLFKAAGKDPVPFIIRTTDDNITIAGEVIVKTKQRTRTPEETTFSVTLLGYTAIPSSELFDFLLLEDGDFILQENDDKIIIS